MIEFLLDDSIVGLRWVLVSVGLIFLLFGIEEILLFLVYLVWRTWKRLAYDPRHRAFTDVLVTSASQQPIAMMVPAWDESAVIRRMLQSTLRKVDYDNYRIFVGVYPNDPDTAREVEAVAAEDDRVQAVILERPGPTTKADCLNQLIDAIRADETARGFRYAAIVMNDAEDVIHPMELRVFNHLIPRMDIVQLPVFPLPVEWWRFTPGHYMDEFSSLHTRELPVRQWLTGAVPSAGVGTGFSRKAIERAAASNHGRVFDETSLTEDYEMTMRLAGPDMREVFVADALRQGPPPLLVLPDAVVRALGADARPGRRLFDTAVAVKEYFPKSFRRAVRQKTRWILGNTLQAWVRLGWRGNLGMRYAFLKDRKVLLGHLAVGIAYIAMALLVLVWIARTIVLGDSRFPDVFPAGSWIAWVMYANLSLACAYVLIRAYGTWLVYGTGQAILSIPRLFWGSLINISAGVRAIWIFLFRSGTVVWDKTDHEFPDEQPR